MCFGSKIPESWRKFVTRQFLIDVALNLSSIIKPHSPWNGFRLSSQRERKALGYNTPQLDKKDSQVGSRHIGFAWRYFCFFHFSSDPNNSQKIHENPLIGKTTEQNMSWNKFTETHRKLWICLLKCTLSNFLCAKNCPSHKHHKEPCKC